MDYSGAQRQKENPDDARSFNSSPEKLRWKVVVSEDQTPKPRQHKQPCDNPADHEEDDTCSQYRSAKAAEEAVGVAKEQADYAWWGIWIGAVAAFATAYAAIEAGRAARAAANSNEIAQDIGKRQLRAYVHVSQAKIVNANSEYGPTISIQIKNWGQTPAYEVRHSFNYAIPLIGAPDFDRLPHCEQIIDIAPGQTLWEASLVPLSLWERRKASIEKGSLIFYVFGKISYFDAFEDRAAGNRRITSYRFKITCDEAGVSDGPLSLCEDGNKAT